jgi:peptidoglycan/LPS O-acetylase OafA/YrhL
MTTTMRAARARIEFLDSMRGVAALSVAVFAHYIIFTNALQPNAEPLSSAPMYSLFRPLYHYSYLAVDFFFVLSGIIFRYVYFDSIARGAVSWRDFFWARLSRLYPLHFLTLMICAGLAWEFFAIAGRFPVYRFNSLYYFMLNVFFLQRGFFDSGWSFNGPSWSLSIEAIMYCFFFGIAISRYGRYLALLLFVAGLALMMSRLNHQFLLNTDVARGLIGFFLGFTIFEAFGNPAKLACTIFILLAAAAVLIGCRLAFGLTVIYGVVSITFAITILVVNRVSFLRRIFEWRPLRLLGDLSLSIYLIHMPVGMAILLLFQMTHRTIPTASPFFFMSYVSLVLISAWAVHRLYESPAKIFLRNHPALGPRLRPVVIDQPAELRLPGRTSRVLDHE